MGLKEGNLMEYGVEAVATAPLKVPICN